MVEKNQVYTFPYDWCKQYDQAQIDVYFDKEKNLPYCKVYKSWGGTKRIYFPRNWGKKYIQRYYNSILCEQDERSPHYYFNPNEEWFDNETLFIDCGAAEGYAGLLLIEKVKKVILIDCDETWEEPLKATFSKWPDKIMYVKKYAGNVSDQNTCRIDEFMNENYKKVCIKVDVEGFEKDVIKGGKDFLLKNNIRLYICLYHNAGDEELIVPIMEGIGYQTSVNKPYLFYKFKDEEEYTFRHGVVKCEKNGRK